MNSAAERILPCPFCGSEEISDGECLSQHENGLMTTQSQCLACGAFGPEAHLNDGEIDFGDIKAIAAWNKRSNTDVTGLAPAQETTK